MSVKVTSRVWETSQQSGAALLLLLALADFSDDDGYSFPEIPALAGKARVTDRGAKGIIAHLERAGEIAVRRGAGRGIRSVYRVLSGLQPADTASTDFSVFKNARVKAPKKVKLATGKGEDDCIALRKNRQLTVINDNGTGANDAPGADANGARPTSPAQSASGVVESAQAKRASGQPQQKPARTPTEQQRYFEAVAKACGLDPSWLAETDRANVGKLASQLQRDAELDLEFLAECARRWPEQWPNRDPATIAPPTIAQLRTWIGRCKGTRVSGGGRVVMRF